MIKKRGFSCFVGDLEETHFIEGTYLTKKGEKYYVYHGKFNSNNEKDGDNAFYYNFNKNGKILDYKQREEMPDKSGIFDQMFDFRNIILAEDYFGQVFNTFKTTMEFIASDVNLEFFDSQEKFPKLINVSFNFNKITIKEEIDKVLAKYE